MRTPGFTADLSFVEPLAPYGHPAAHHQAGRGEVEPAFRVRYERVCWCAEEGMCEVRTWYERLLGLGGRLVECCVRTECVEIPIFY
jgi:hypothetical protein